MSVRKTAILFLSFVSWFFLCSCVTQSRDIKTASRSYSYYIRGLLSDRLGDYEEAALFYRRADSADQTDAVVRFQLGFDLIRLERYSQAVDEFEKVLSLSPQHDDARYILALLYVQLDDYPKAIKQYERLLESELNTRAQNIELRRILSQLYFLQEDYARAQEQCRFLLKIDPFDEVALYFLATIDLKEGRVQEAAAHFQEIIAHYPQASEAKNALAYLYCEEDINLSEALSLAEEAVEANPLNGAYLDTLGYIYFKMGEIDKAIEYLRNASQLMFDPVIFDHLAQAYVAKNMAREAKEAWQTSMKLDPGQEGVRRRLKELNSKKYDVRREKNQ